MIQPIHTATIGGHPLRFFRTPNDDGKPDMPWHSIDDLHRCLGLNRELRKLFLSKLRKWGSIRTVATADGIVTIAPHYMAQGCINAMVEKGIVPPDVRDAYDYEGSVALNKLVAHLPFPSDYFFAWMKAAMNRHEHADAKG
jgi:hypothetical protein